MFPGFCIAAIKSCWGQDKTTTEGKISVNLSHHINFLNRRQIFVLLAMLGKHYPLRFSLQPHIISFIQTDLPNLPFSLQLTVPSIYCPLSSCKFRMGPRCTLLLKGWREAEIQRGLRAGKTKNSNVFSGPMCVFHFLGISHKRYPLLTLHLQIKLAELKHTTYFWRSHGRSR